EHHDVVVPHSRLGIDRIGTWRAEEDEAAPAHLVDVVALRSALDADTRHGTSQLAQVGDGRAAGARHALDCGTPRRGYGGRMGALSGLVDRGLIAPDWAEALAPV